LKPQPRTEVVSVRIEAGLLTRLDDIVSTNKNYKDRSHFVGVAIREKLIKDFQDSELQAIALRKINKDILTADDKISTLIELFGHFLTVYFMHNAPLPFDKEGQMAAIRIPAQKQYDIFIKGFIEHSKNSGTGLLSKLSADLIEEQGESHG